jgi:hypothetical protein
MFELLMKFFQIKLLYMHCDVFNCSLKQLFLKLTINNLCMHGICYHLVFSVLLYIHIFCGFLNLLEDIY